MGCSIRRVARCSLVVASMCLLLQQTAFGDYDYESPTRAKKHGEFMFGLGIPFGATLRSEARFSYGGVLKLSYEMELARIDGTILFQTSAGTSEKLYFGTATVEGHYVPLPRNVSPYVGGGLGYVIADDSYTTLRHGLLFYVAMGVEFFRLYSIRLLLDTRVGFPSFKLGSRYVPIFTGMVVVLW